MRCPTATEYIDPEGNLRQHTIIGCGSPNVIGPDVEGLWDCLECGIFFRPEKENS
jgi:hypothetical protein